jgi:acyl carrier protein
MSEMIKEVCQIVTNTLMRSANVTQLSAPVGPETAMNDLKEWDSLSFVDVLVSVSEHFMLEIDDDDAIQFTSVTGIVDLIEEIKAE